MRKRWVVWLLATIVLAVVPLRAQDDVARGVDDKQKQHGRVLLVSLDAFRPEAYRDDRFKTPNLRALVACGVSAKKCVGVFLTLTYPSHTTIATGVRTARHGIFSNTIFDPKDGGKRWYFDAAHVQATTLWDAAHKAGVKTSALHWPVTVGSNTIDYHIPE